MSAPKAVIEAAKKEAKRLQKQSDRIEYLLTAWPFDKPRKEKDLLIRCQTKKTIELYRKQSDIHIEISKIKEWVALEEWKAKKNKS